MNAKIDAIAETSSGNSLAVIDIQSRLLSVKKNVSAMTKALADRLSHGRDETFGAYRIGPYSGFIDKTPDIMEDILADTQQDTKFDRLLDTTPDVFGDSEDVMPVNQN